MTEIIEKELVYKIVGCAIKVHNELGCGLREKTYERALCLEMDSQQIQYSKQMKFPVYYQSVLIDEYIPDLLVDNKIIIEIKTAESIVDEHRGQLLNYLRIAGIKVGLIINFNHPKLEWERLVL